MNPAAAPIPIDSKSADSKATDSKTNVICFVCRKRILDAELGRDRHAHLDQAA
jgi:hypothetical protein